jgi:hypothetical protein
VIDECPYRGSLLGPAENPLGCLTCRGGGSGSNRDDVIEVLEQSEIPLPHWDIKRVLDRDRAYSVHNGSLLVWLGQDGRACWGGKGIYGLYRHGLLPGVRDLGTPAALYLYVTDLVLDYREVWFVMKNSGYRSEEVSIYYALRRAEQYGLVTQTWAVAGVGLLESTSLRRSSSACSARAGAISSSCSSGPIVSSSEDSLNGNDVYVVEPSPKADHAAEIEANLGLVVVDVLRRWRKVAG